MPWNRLGGEPKASFICEESVYVSVNGKQSDCLDCRKGQESRPPPSRRCCGNKTIREEDAQPLGRPEVEIVQEAAIAQNEFSPWDGALPHLCLQQCMPSPMLEMFDLEPLAKAYPMSALGQAIPQLDV